VRVIGRLWPEYEFNELSGIKIAFGDAVLDVGCGAGANLLNRMARVGFDNVLGADPFIPADIVTSAGVKVLQCDISGVEGGFDLIMFHHSFEHIGEPRETLRLARSRLKLGGKCLIRIPTPSSDAFDLYGKDWVQLDAPRHLSLISRSGMDILAQDCGFRMESVRDDSTDFQFSSSELYCEDVPLVEQKLSERYSVEELEVFSEKARLANARSRGDQAAFLLQAV
jgi:SAM-dependent methyltransferase